MWPDCRTWRTVYFFFLQDRSKVRLLDIVQLDDFLARDIVKVILEYYELRKLLLENLAMLTSDGASVMTGRSGGVFAL